MDIVRRMTAEFIGTFALVFVGVGAVCAPVPHKNLLSIALAFGLTVAVMVSATGHISGGQFNPAVSLALLVTRKMSLHDAAVYILSQLAGALMAALLLKWFFGVYAVADGVTTPSAVFTPMKTLVLEIVTTFFLVFVIFGVAVDKRGPNLIAGLLIGLTVILDILIAGPYTGASMNPARSFGPALATGKWDAHWIYWVGPITGGVLAGVVYNAFFLPKQNASASRV
jgi:MIP family channel proteins